MSDSISECSQYARRLGDLLASLPVDSAWGDVEAVSCNLANALRNRNGPGAFEILVYLSQLIICISG